MIPANVRILAVMLIAVIGAAVSWGEFTSEAVPVTWQRDTVLIPVYLNQVGPYPFLLDTHIQAMVINMDVAIHLGLEIQDRLPSLLQDKPLDPAFRGAAHLDDVRIGAAAAPITDALVMNLNALTPRTGLRVAGILPAYLSGCSLTLDLAAGIAHLTPNTGNEPAPAKASPSPGAAGVIQGKHARTFDVDTTFSGTVALPEDQLRAMGLMTGTTPRLICAGMVNETRQTPGECLIRLESLQIGSVNLEHPVCTVLENEAAAKIGLGFLRNFRATFTKNAQGATQVHFEHSMGDQGSPVEPALTGTGISLTEVVSGGWQIRVAHGSPAAKAELTSGDVLVSVNGNRVNKLDYASVSAMLALCPGEEADVTVIRDGEPHVATLTSVTLLD